jgi:hypothetical protein
MKELLQLAWDTVRFRHEAYAQHVARPDALKRGLALLVLVTLVAGLVPFFISLVGDLRPVDIEEQRSAADQGIQEFLSSLDTMRQFVDLPPDVERQIVANMKAGIDMGLRIEALPTALPKPLGRILQDLGLLLSLPFSRMAGWIGYAIWVLLVAKLLGGRATVSEMLGATALYATPHVLGILGFVPCLGGLLGLAATLWGIAIYVKAVAVSHDLSIRRAIVATIAPGLIIGALLLMGGLTTLILTLLSASS